MMRTERRRPDADARGGYALLVVLWLVVGLAALSFASLAAARTAVAASTNRQALAVAEWHSSGCLATMRAWLDGRLAGWEPGTGPSPWVHLDQAVSTAGADWGCRLAFEPVGSRLDVNHVSEGRLREVLVRVATAAAADSLVAALADWTDTDTVARRFGAEESWYAAAGLPSPSNGRIGSLAELRQVRGVHALSGGDSVLGVEPGPLALSHASAPLLMDLPGMTPGVVARIAAERQRGWRFGTLADIGRDLSPEDRDAFEGALPDLVRLVMLEPVAWVVTSRTGAGKPEVAVVAEWRIGRAGNVAVVERSRMWIE